MKKFAVFMAVIVLLAAVGFALFKMGKIPQITFGEATTTTTSSATESKKVHIFSSRIEAVSGDMLTVNPDKNSDEYKSSDKITFSTKGIKITDEKGTAIREDDIGNFASARVRYSGAILETYPAQIKAINVVLSERAYCNVHFVVNGNEIETLTVEKGAGVDSSDMPNAGAYCKVGTHFVSWQNENGEPILSLEKITDTITLTAKIAEN